MNDRERLAEQIKFGVAPDMVASVIRTPGTVTAEYFDPYTLYLSEYMHQLCFGDDRCRFSRPATKREQQRNRRRYMRGLSR